MTDTPATKEVIDECAYLLKVDTKYLTLIQVPMGCLSVRDWCGIPVKESFAVECITFFIHISLEERSD